MNTASLQTTLKELRLSGLCQTLGVRLQEAAANRLGHAEFLELILQDELNVRQQRQLERRIKAADFHTLTRSLTPPTRPISAGELATIACTLRERVERQGDSRYRLVGVGLAGFVDRDSYQAQTDLFDTPQA